MVAIRLWIGGIRELTLHPGVIFFFFVFVLLFYLLVVDLLKGSDSGYFVLIPGTSVSTDHAFGAWEAPSPACQCLVRYYLSWRV